MEEQGDEMDVILGGAAASVMALETTSDGGEPLLDMFRATKRVRLRGGEGINIGGRAAEWSGRGLRSKEGVGAARVGVVTTVRVHATVATG